MITKRILVAPLDWGLGHATRCIPIINELLKQKVDVLLAGSGPSLELLRQEYPLLKVYALPGYCPVYPYTGSMIFGLAKQAGKFVRVVKQERKALSQIIEKEKIDLVISDNRYGCYSAKIPCVFVGHQLNLITPPWWHWLRWLVGRAARHYIKKFTQCWIPDFPGSVLSGKLSERADKRVRFIGPLSRFGNDNNLHGSKYDILALISGPEPQRSIFEGLITKQLLDFDHQALIVRGVIGDQRRKISEKIEVVDYLKGSDLEQAILQSEIIIARSGYSTIMDLAKLRKKAIFVPTPGQTEQEYLANRFMDLGICFSIDQKSFSLKEALYRSANFIGFKDYSFDDSLLKQSITELLAGRLMNDQPQTTISQLTT